MFQPRALGQRSVILRLAFAQALYLAGAAIAFTFSGLVGQSLAPDPALATLPMALMTAATMATTIPASLLMGRFGRRRGFVTGAALGVVGSAVAGIAIVLESFLLFCAGNALLGGYQAFAMYYRFAAADAADDEHKGSAIGWVLTGGVIAALLGPAIGSWSRSWWPAAELAGAFAAAALLAFMAMGVLATLRLDRPAKTQDSGERRALSLIARQPAFIAAVVSAVAAYAVMSFVMTASPLAVVATGQGLDAAADVTRWHLLGMFAPSFVTGRIVTVVGPVPVLLAGGVLLLASLLGALTGVSTLHFNMALFTLGVGWNLLYVAATTLLTQAYRPSERARVQGLNEFLVFGATAIATLAAGAAQVSLGWSVVNQLAIPLVLVAILTTLWLALGQRRAAVARADSSSNLSIRKVLHGLASSRSSS